MSNNPSTNDRSPQGQGDDERKGAAAEPRATGTPPPQKSEAPRGTGGINRASASWNNPRAVGNGTAATRSASTGSKAAGESSTGGQTSGYALRGVRRPAPTGAAANMAASPSANPAAKPTAKPSAKAATAARTAPVANPASPAGKFPPRQSLGKGAGDEETKPIPKKEEPFRGDPNDPEFMEKLTENRRKQIERILDLKKNRESDPFYRLASGIWTDPTCSTRDERPLPVCEDPESLINCDPELARGVRTWFASDDSTLEQMLDEFLDMGNENAENPNPWALYLDDEDKDEEDDVDEEEEEDEESTKAKKKERPRADYVYPPNPLYLPDIPTREMGTYRVWSTPHVDKSPLLNQKRERNFNLLTGSIMFGLGWMIMALTSCFVWFIVSD